MNIRVENNLIEFSGYLSEKTNPEALRTAFLTAAQSTQDNTVRVDFSKVEKANSVGILAYLKAFDSAKVRAVYERAPIWLVEQFNCIPEFFAASSTVISFYARFFSPRTRKPQNVLLTVDKDVSRLPHYKNYSFTISDESGAALEPDFDPELYFFFLTEKSEP